MEWSNEKPKKAGWYVTKRNKSDDHAKYYIVEVYRESKILVARAQGYTTATPLNEIKNTEFSWLLLEEE